MLKNILIVGRKLASAALNFLIVYFETIALPMSWALGGTIMFTMYTELSNIFNGAVCLLVGLWHFTVPWMFGWASYIPYETLVVPINYVNLCFSFLLSGLSLTVILWGKRYLCRTRKRSIFTVFCLHFGSSV